MDFNLEGWVIYTVSNCEKCERVDNMLSCLNQNVSNINCDDVLNDTYTKRLFLKEMKVYLQTRNIQFPIIIKDGNFICLHEIYRYL